MRCGWCCSIPRLRRCWVIRPRLPSGRGRNCGSNWADRIGSLSVARTNSGNSPLRSGRPLARLEGAEEAWERVSNLAHWLQQKYRDVTVLKAALPVVASEEFLSRAQQEAEAERIALASFAQVGVGIVHLCALAGDTERQSCGPGGPPAAGGGRPWGHAGHRTLSGGPQEPGGRLGRGRRRSCRHAQNEICLGPRRRFCRRGDSWGAFKGCSADLFCRSAARPRWQGKAADLQNRSALHLLYIDPAIAVEWLNP